MTSRTFRISLASGLALSLAACLQPIDDTSDPAVDVDSASGLPAGVTLVQTGADTFTFSSPSSVLPVQLPGTDGDEAQRVLSDTPAVRDFHLVANQTAVKDQGTWGACVTFSHVGALEAAYRRNYGVNLDLSELHYMQTCKTSTPIVDQAFPGVRNGILLQNPVWPVSSTDWKPVESTSVSPLAEETHAPYPNVQTLINLAIADYGFEAERTVSHPTTGEVKTIPWYPPSQAVVDEFDLGREVVSEEARLHARYGVTPGAIRIVADYQNPDTFESIVTDGSELMIGLGFNGLNCRNLTASDGEMVAPRVCTTGSCTAGQLTAPTSVCNYDPTYQVAGVHAMVVVGYARDFQATVATTTQSGYFLVKNSWGGSFPYWWVSYDAVRHLVGNASYIAPGAASLRAPASGDHLRSRWVGLWDLVVDGKPVQLNFRHSRVGAGSLAPYPTTIPQDFEAGFAWGDRKGTWTSGTSSQWFVGDFVTDWSLRVGPSVPNLANNETIVAGFASMASATDTYTLGIGYSSSEKAVWLVRRGADTGMTFTPKAGFRATDWVGSWSLTGEGGAAGTIVVQSVTPTFGGWSVVATGVKANGGTESLTGTIATATPQKVQLNRPICQTYARCGYTMYNHRVNEGLASVRVFNSESIFGRIQPTMVRGTKK